MLIKYDNKENDKNTLIKNNINRKNKLFEWY